MRAIIAGLLVPAIFVNWAFAADLSPIPGFIKRAIASAKKVGTKCEHVLKATALQKLGINPATKGLRYRIAFDPSRQHVENVWSPQLTYDVHVSMSGRQLDVHLSVVLSPSDCGVSDVVKSDANRGVAEYVRYTEAEELQRPQDYPMTGHRIALSRMPIILRAGTSETMISCQNRGSIRIKHDSYASDRTLSQFAIYPRRRFDAGTITPNCHSVRELLPSFYTGDEIGVLACDFSKGSREWAQSSITDVNFWIKLPHRLPDLAQRFTYGDLSGFLAECTGGALEKPRVPEPLEEAK